MRLVVVLFGCAALSPTIRAEVIALTNGSERCAIDTQGGRVLSYAVDGQELLWMPEGELGDDPIWRHGGIPIAWPWFGRIGKGDENIHGYAWKQPLVVKSRAADGLVLSLKTESAVLEYSIRIDNGLSLALQTTNMSAFDLPIGVAFHPYFRVGERDRTFVSGIDTDAIAVTNAIDRGVRFDAVKPCCAYLLADRARNLLVRISAENSSGVNLWNPGREKQCPGVVPADEWRHFVAVEPYAMGQNRFLVLKPKQVHVLKMKVKTVGD